MDSKAFMSILFSLTVALATESNATLNRLIEATDTTPFAQCNPFNAQAKGLTSCEEYFKSSLTFEACDLNLAWHDICVGAIPEGKGSLREICPTECARKVLGPELEDDDAVAVENFIDFLKKDEFKHRREGRNLGRRKLEAVPEYKEYPGYGSGSGNFIAQFEDSDVGECHDLCNRRTLCAGFTIFNNGMCNLKGAITLTQNGNTWNRVTLVKIVAPVPGYEQYPDYASGPGNHIAQFDDLTAEECADLCNGQGTICAGFTIFDHGRCNLKGAITLTQNRRTFNRATYVKNVPPV